MAGTGQTSGPNQESREIFQKFKSLCVPLSDQSYLTPDSIPKVSKLLRELISVLHQTQSNGSILKPSLISYVFFPISTVFRRNPMHTIPDQVLEQLFTILALLCESWWWTMDEAVWEQLFLLSGAVIGGLEGKGKEKQRSDETKEAAVKCLWALVHERSPNDASPDSQGHASNILAKFRKFTQQPKFIPIMGQTIDSLLSMTESSTRSTQKISLEVLYSIFKFYLLDDFAPSILPGVVSRMCRIALGRTTSRGWANGDIVSASLKAMQEIVVKSVGDAICQRAGVVQIVQGLDDLTNGIDHSYQSEPSSSKYMVSRSPSWLNAVASQLHIALNSLQPLVSHPTPSALLALAETSGLILQQTIVTLPQSHALLLSFLLALSASDFDSVSRVSRVHLLDLLQKSSISSATLLPVVLQITRDNLGALRRLIPLHADTKIEHAANIVRAVCELASANNPAQRIDAISQGVGRLLGANGGIERWGWGLLSVIELSSPSITYTSTSTGLLALEGDASSSNTPTFPPLLLRHISSHTAQQALEGMFHSMGRAAGDQAIFAVEWFLAVGFGSRGTRATSALWCASRLLEGVGGLSLVDTFNDADLTKRSKRLVKFARGFTKTIADEWQVDPEDLEANRKSTDDPMPESNEVLVVEHVRGLIPIRETQQHQPSLPSMNGHPLSSQVAVHKALLLQLLSLTAGILQARFTSLLLHALYPILHSLISPVDIVSTTALATLQYIANTTSYATPANMLLSNFDYALDAVSRHLTRRWLDVDATRVLTVLVRLVGRDVVQKAGDVVEECFDRLDEYHGYEILVDGLVAVLAEVVAVIAADTGDEMQPQEHARDETQNVENMQDFQNWFSNRHKPAATDDDDVDIGPVPQQAWSREETGSEEGARDEDTNPVDEPQITPIQTLTSQIVTRSLYFLTHGSPLIRARILSLLSSGAAVLPGSAILPSIHRAWPFILNRLSDPEAFVVSAAVSLVESLATHHGEFMYRRIWDDIWPRFKTMLAKLDAADSSSALARRGHGSVGTQSAYTHSHRMYKGVLKTMVSAAKHVQVHDSSVWEVILSFRRFLHKQAHKELQTLARDLYIILSKNNADAIWFALSATQNSVGSWLFLQQNQWDIGDNLHRILL
ncbi:hypothetical protein QCA50_002155 [Cerrena zonata]|uniref:TEL2-interacting protein 1 n=1 Tax=Cerrena zonata TaxID=2478898 RepID=A0AAW0GSP5_9APHY